MHVCRFYPGYANSYKDVPCDSAQGAQALKDWFIGLGVKAEYLEYDEYYCTKKGAVPNKLANEDVRPGRKFAVYIPAKDTKYKSSHHSHHLFARCFRKR